MNIFDSLPDNQKKYINKELFKRCLKYVKRSKYQNNIDEYIQNDEDPQNTKRYCDLILRYF